MKICERNVRIWHVGRAAAAAFVVSGAGAAAMGQTADRTSAERHAGYCVDYPSLDGFDALVIYTDGGAFASITMEGVWHDTCVPRGPVLALEGSRILFALDGVAPPGMGCGDALTEWSARATIGPLAAGVYEIYTVIWPDDPIRRWDLEVVRPATEPCYANCDGSREVPSLNVDDFVCFINRFSEGQSLRHEEQIGHYANCDGSVVAPVLNVDDLVCFINAFAAGCP